MTAVVPDAAVRFTLPPDREAHEPPEHRGLARDEVRLLVSSPDAVQHRRFRDLPDVLSPGDVVVVNTSATLPASLDARTRDGRRLPLHVSTQLDDGDWVVEPRLPDGTGSDTGHRVDDRLHLPGDLSLRLVEAYPDPRAQRSRLWRATPSRPTPSVDHLARFGRPVRYGYVPHGYPLADYQTVFADEPGSAEMASAGRPFTAELVVALVRRGIAVVPVTLHAGVSSPEAHEPPLPERYAVPPATARLVNAVRAGGGRVVAVGTTVTRALESATVAGGTVVPAHGWTDLVLGPHRPAVVVNGLVTGLHAPEASHLLLLEAVAGTPLVRAAYDAALRSGYLWHEFGDSSLLLP